MSEENDTRKQVEDDQNEDLELESEDADDVRGGATQQMPGNLKWGDVTLKRG